MYVCVYDIIWHCGIRVCLYIYIYIERERERETERERERVRDREREREREIDRSICEAETPSFHQGSVPAGGPRGRESRPRDRRSIPCRDAQSYRRLPKPGGPHVRATPACSESRGLPFRVQNR